MKKNVEQLMKISVALLGLLMLVAGLTKLFGAGVSGITDFLSGNWLLSWAPGFFAVVLIIAEIGSGLAILAKWKLNKVAWIPVVILGLAILTNQLNWSNLGATNWNMLILSLIAITGYLMLTKE